MIPRLAPDLGLRDVGRALHPGVGVAEFEDAFAKLAGTRHAVAFPYGRTGLMFLLEALGLQGQEVICPSYTCVVVPHAIVHSGNRPVFVDCAPQSYLMDLELASEAVTPDTGAIIATSFFGEPVDAEQLRVFCEKHPEVTVIQDCAHSFFCGDAQQPTHRNGVAAIYGLNISKLITSVFGGMVTTDDDQVAAALRSGRNERIVRPALVKGLARRLYFVASIVAFSNLFYGVVRRVQALGLIDRFTRYYNEALIDMPEDYLVGMTDFEASIGLSQIERYQGVVDHRRSLAEMYHSSLEHCEHLVLPDRTEGHTWSHYVVGTNRAQAYIRKGFQQNIEFGELLDYFIPDMPSYKGERHFDRGIARSYVGNVINLPVHKRVDASAAQRIIELVRDTETHV